MKTILQIIVTSLVLLSSSALFALECEDASGEAFGAFKGISINESTAKVTITSYSSIKVFPELELLSGPGKDKVYHFNEYFTEKKGTR